MAHESRYHHLAARVLLQDHLFSVRKITANRKKEFNFLKQEPAYKTEGPDPNRGSYQQ